jgi:mono/diheme cytochrome c family protein
VRETAELSKEDRAAIATYVKSLGPVEGPKPPKKAEARGL